MQQLIFNKKTHHIDWSAFETSYLALLEPRIIRRFYSARKPIRKRILEFIHLNLKDILIGDPIKLEMIISKFKRNRSEGSTFHNYIQSDSDFRANLNYIFDYKWFRDNHGSWLGQAVGIKACPYCNSQFVLTLEKEQKAMFHFDHFFPKKIFPYLGVSLYNLIPSCFYCNNRKSDEEYATKSLAHPYIDSFNRIASFATQPASIIKFLSDSKINAQHVEIKILKAKGYGLPGDDLKLKNQNKIFLIDGVYDNHKDIAADIYLKARTYNKSMRADLLRLGRNAGITFLTEADIDRMVTGNFTTDAQINDRPLSKFSSDISREAKLIK